MACYSSGNSKSPTAGGSGSSGGGGYTTNATATLYRKNGFSRYGKIQYVNGGTFKIQIVSLSLAEKKSSVRVDVSASKSTVDEELYDSVIFIDTSSGVVVGDGMTVDDGVTVYEMRVAKVAGVYSASAGLVRYEVSLVRLEG